MEWLIGSRFEARVASATSPKSKSVMRIISTCVMSMHYSINDRKGYTWLLIPVHLLNQLHLISGSGRVRCTQNGYDHGVAVSWRWTGAGELMCASTTSNLQQHFFCLTAVSAPNLASNITIHGEDRQGALEWSMQTLPRVYVIAEKFRLCTIYDHIEHPRQLYSLSPSLSPQWCPSRSFTIKLRAFIAFN